MDITGKIVTLIAGKLKYLILRAILFRSTRPTYPEGCQEYQP